LTGRTLEGENTHLGFVTIADLPYEGFVFAARNANFAILVQPQRGNSNLRNSLP